MDTKSGNSRLIDVHRPLNICRASAGTGKTFTLAAYYVGLLLSGEDYRSILAITFTNKATCEMSERIMGYLYGIAHGSEDAFLSRAKEFMLRPAGSDEALRQRAQWCFESMLLDYDHMQVQTIDSFLQTLLSGLAGVLQMSSGLNTELDVDHIIQTAVDQLLSTEMSEADRLIMEDYMQLKLDQESHWDVRQSLCMMAKELYNESVQMLDAEGKIQFNALSIEESRQAIEEAWSEHADVRQLQACLAGVHPEALVTDPAPGQKKMAHAGDVMKAYERLTETLKNPSRVPSKDRFRGLTDNQLSDAQAGKWTALPASTVQAIIDATLVAARCKRTYNTLQLTIRFSRDMQLMGSLQALIQRNLEESNSALLAKTANTLCKALQEGDADFILEKAGIRYRHILIDEFQDTSSLQWQVIDRLLRDVLAGEGHTLLIVGDIKQSIYRWRNGDWHIMAELDHAPYYAPLYNRDFPQLTRNYRSSEEVVRFNLSLFRQIASTSDQWESIYSEGFTPETLDAFYQSDKKPGGFVRFHAFRKPAREAMVYDMFDAIESLLAQGSQAEQMMILVREKKDAAYITDLHTMIALDADEGTQIRYPHLRQASMVSADSFLLEASEDVKLIIAGLRYMVHEDPLSAKLIELRLGALPEHGLCPNTNRQTPLYELMSELIAQLLCDENGHYIGTETAYINSLLDRTRAFVSTYGSNPVEFLAYWDDTLHAKPIPASATNAIRILTVHASKGLQAQTLFVPFCNWTKEAGHHPQKIWCEEAPEVQAITHNDPTFVPIQDGTEMAESAYESSYAEEHRNMCIDNLNMLYVALTRAEDNLYISSDFSITAKGQLGACNHVGEYLLHFTGLDEQILSDSLPTTPEEAVYAEYVAGTPKIVLPAGTQKMSSNPFSFAGSAVREAELWSSSEQVRFVQSQEGAMYTDCGEEAYRRVARMEEGTLCHEIFAHLHKADELDDVLDMFESNGSIGSPEQREELKHLISSAWEGSDEMRDWFTSPWQLHLEEAIYIDRRELRPDRVMINPETNEAIVLDYKFGVWENEYIDQVRTYMHALQQMGYSPVRGYLWFAREGKLVKVES